MYLFETGKKNAISPYETYVNAKRYSNPKLFRRHFTKKDKNRDKFISLIDESNIVNEQSRCADILKSYFSSVFTVVHRVQMLIITGFKSYEGHEKSI